MKKLLILGMFFSVLVQARYHKVTSSAHFDRLLDQYEYSIACFASRSANSELFENIQNRLIAASKRDEFNTILKSDVGFLMVDASLPKLKDTIKDLENPKFPCVITYHQDFTKRIWFGAPRTATDIISMLQASFARDLKNLIKDRRSDEWVFREEMLGYYPYGGVPYAWYPYAFYPYSRWGTAPYGTGWGFTGTNDF